MTIYFLIFAFALISFFGNNIRTAKGQDTGGTIDTSGDFSLKSCDGSVFKDVAYEDSPIKVNLTGSTSRINTTQFKVNLNLKYQTSLQSTAWTKTATIKEMRPPSREWSIGTSTSTTQTATIKKGEANTYRADIIMCWYNIDSTGKLDGTGKSRVTYRTENFQINNPADGISAPTTQSSKDGTAIGASSNITPASTSTSTTAADKCKDTGSTYRWYAPTTWVSSNIATSICEMQVTIINWESSIIGWMISKVLYPALGLCVEGGTPACPEPEMITP